MSRAIMSKTEKTEYDNLFACRGEKREFLEWMRARGFGVPTMRDHEARR